MPQKENKHGFSFHYSPYNFDSLPEKDFLYQILTAVNLKPSKIEDIYFIGGLSSPKQTDILFEYQNDQKDWKLYAPKVKNIKEIWKIHPHPLFDMHISIFGKNGNF